ncbi:MAG: twin-arginine translocase subunit TatC [Chloroflexota bacterium]
MADSDRAPQIAGQAGRPLPAGADPNTSQPAVMTLIGHLTELRARVIRICLGLAAGTAIGFALAPAIRRLLVSPLPTQQVQALAPGDAFSITLRVALMAGVAISMPVTLYQVWAFIRPGLTPAERRVFWPWLIAAVVLFAVGVGVAWFVLPYAITFLLAFTDETIVGDRFAAGPYFDFVTTMFLGIGLALEFPVVLVGLARIGLVSAQLLGAAAATPSLASPSSPPSRRLEGMSPRRSCSAC